MTELPLSSRLWTQRTSGWSRWMQSCSWMRGRGPTTACMKSRRPPRKRWKPSAWSADDQTIPWHPSWISDPTPPDTDRLATNKSNWNRYNPAVERLKECILLSFEMDFQTFADYLALWQNMFFLFHTCIMEMCRTWLSLSKRALHFTLNKLWLHCVKAFFLFFFLDKNKCLTRQQASQQIKK